MKIEREMLASKLAEMKKSGFAYLVKITAVDYIKSITILYFIRDIGAAKDEILEIELDPADLWVPTVMHIYSAADWYERELSEMFGVEIKGRKAERLLLEKWDGKSFPLRKSFAWNAPYEGM